MRQSREDRLSKKRAWYSNNKQSAQEYYFQNQELIREKARRRYQSKRGEILAYCKRRNLENPEVNKANKARHKKWREANRERWLAGKKLWWKNRSHEQKLKKKEYYQKNKEAIKRKVKEYVQLHPEVPCNTAAKRRALKMSTQVNINGIKEWMRQMRSKPVSACHWCGDSVVGRAIQFDHVVALNKGGSHTIGNICACCRDCNYSKHDKDLSEWVRRGQRFLSL